jgi:PleD family two-component response regulator
LIEEHIFPGFPKVVKVTVSMGVATYPQHGATGDELITRADEAQYASKRTGKNKVTVATTAAEDQGKKGEAFFIESRFDGLNVKDNMTGLFNASYFSMRLKDEIRRVSRYLIPCSLVLVRVAWPSEETTRRELLKKTGMVLKESLREGIDTPAVLDENTLAVIVPETPPELAAPIAERLRAALETRAFGSLAPGLKMSACVVSCPFHGKEENELMRNAFLFLGKAQEEEGNWIVTGAAEPD